MLEFIQLQKSFENTDPKECVSCSKKLKVSAYCFKCRAFLCKHCLQFHQISAMFKDHTQYILSLGNVDKKFMLKELATLTPNPKCNHHIEQEASLCCRTCGNQPVCMMCVYGKHKRHDLKDVAEEGARQRKSLETKVLDIKRHRHRLFELRNVIDKSRKQLREDVKDEFEKINLQYNQQVEKIKDKMKQRKLERRKNVDIIKERREKKLNEIRRKHENEIKEVVTNYYDELDETDAKHNNIMEELEKKLERLENDFKEITEGKQEKQKKIELQKISEYCENVIKRYEIFKETASSILASNYEWADAQSIPDVKAAGDSLLEELKELQKQESLSHFKIDYLSKTSVDVVSTIDVERVLGGIIESVTNVYDGNMVITGSSSKQYSHITVINSEGKILRKHRLRRTGGLNPWRRCCRLSEFKVATVSKAFEVGIYDVRDGSYNSKNIIKIIPNLSVIMCVTTDPLNNQIIVGTNDREVLVFDDKLNYVKTIELPSVVRYQKDISSHEGNLLVCAHYGSAHAIKVEGCTGYVMYGFNKPDTEGPTWVSCGVSTGMTGFIYILWQRYFSGENKMLVQYSRDGQHILSKTTVDKNSSCITTVERPHAELCVVAASNTRKLYTYRFREEESMQT